MLRGMTENEIKWSERVREWKESGKTLHEFVATQPYKATTLRWWATELRRRNGTLAERARKKNTAPIPMARVVSRSVERAEGAIILEVAGARVRVQRGFDAGLLGEVLRALQ